MGEKDWIPATERIELCENVIRSNDDIKSWISVAKGESQYDRFVDFDEVSRTLARFLNHHLVKEMRLLTYPLKVVYVCGLDHFNKCPYAARLAHDENMACAIIYRPDAVDKRIQSSVETTQNLYYISLENKRETLVDISSTAIRKYFSGSNNINLLDYTYQCVIDYLEKKYSNN